jgi:hypothetical protein
MKQLGVSPIGRSLTCRGYTISESTDPSVLLFMRQDPVISTDPEVDQHQVNLTLYRQRQLDGAIITTGGLLCFTIEIICAPALGEIDAILACWNSNFPSSDSEAADLYRLEPLPIKDYDISTVMAHGWGPAVVRTQRSGEQSQVTLQVELDGFAAESWANAFRSKRQIPGGIRFQYNYLRLLPEVNAHIHVDGVRFYESLTEGFSLLDSVPIVLSRAQIEKAWSSFVDQNVIVVLTNVSNPNNTELNQSVRKICISQALLHIFDDLFSPVAIMPDNTDTPNITYSLSWQSHENAKDFDLDLEIVGWTWLKTQGETNFTSLFNQVSRDSVHNIYSETKFPISLTVSGHPMLESVNISWSASEGGLPQIAFFGPKGGTQEYILSSNDPKQVSISYKAQVNFQPAAWPLIEVSDRARVDRGGNHIVLRPGDWVATLNIYLYVLEGDEIAPLKDLSPHDHFVINFNYDGPHLMHPIRSSERISTDEPVEFNFPLDPRGRPGQATVTAFGVMGERLRRSPELSIDVEEGTVFLLVKEQEIELLSATSPFTEASRSMRKLLTTRARPSIRRRFR